MGIGIPAVAQRMSFTKEAMAYAHGATLGWWNHTCKDNLDKCNIDTLVLDTKVHLAMICKLADSMTSKKGSINFAKILLL